MSAAEVAESLENVDNDKSADLVSDPSKMKDRAEREPEVFEKDPARMISAGSSRSSSMSKTQSSRSSSASDSKTPPKPKGKRRADGQNPRKQSDRAEPVRTRAARLRDGDRIDLSPKRELYNGNVTRGFALGAKKRAERQNKNRGSAPVEGPDAEEDAAEGEEAAVAAAPMAEEAPVPEEDPVVVEDPVAAAAEAEEAAPVEDDIPGESNDDVTSSSSSIRSVSSPSDVSEVENAGSNGQHPRGKLNKENCLPKMKKQEIITMEQGPAVDIPDQQADVTHNHPNAGNGKAGTKRAVNLRIADEKAFWLDFHQKMINRMKKASGSSEDDIWTLNVQNVFFVGDVSIYDNSDRSVIQIRGPDQRRYETVNNGEHCAIMNGDNARSTITDAAPPMVVAPPQPVVTVQAAPAPVAAPVAVEAVPPSAAQDKSDNSAKKAPAVKAPGDDSSQKSNKSNKSAKKAAGGADKSNKSNKSNKGAKKGADVSNKSAKSKAKEEKSAKKLAKKQQKAEEKSAKKASKALRSRTRSRSRRSRRSKPLPD